MQQVQHFSMLFILRSDLQYTRNTDREERVMFEFNAISSKPVDFVTSVSVAVVLVPIMKSDLNRPILIRLSINFHFSLSILNLHNGLPSRKRMKKILN